MDTFSTIKLDSHFINLILDSMAGGVFTLNEKGKISLWNRAMEKISGFSAEEVMGKGCNLLSFDL
jgi:PAS domain S-box-containing protein